MASIIVISDVHGSTHWKTIVQSAKSQDKIIFLGDYFDLRGHGPFARSEEDNFLEICEYAKNRPGTVLLVGNHDYDYMFPLPNIYIYGRDKEKARIFRKVLDDNADLLEMVYVDRYFPRPVIFSHGGLTNQFLKNNGLNSPEEVNDFWISHPQKFNWLEYDPLSLHSSRGDGDNEWQPPTWVRTNALYRDGVKGFDQVVGHTPVRSLAKFFTSNGDLILLTCTLDARAVTLEEDLNLAQNTAHVILLKV